MRLVRVLLTLVLTAGVTSGVTLRASPALAAADPVIAAAGDIACDPAASVYNGGNGTGTDCVAKATATLLGGVDAVLPLGDEQYACGGLAAFNQSYEGSWGPQKTVSHPVPGNHEYQTTGGTDCSTNAAGYYTYFGPAAGDPAKGYYSYSIGAWHIVALNSELCFTGTGCDVGSPEESWLRADLAAHASAPCTLAYWHEPRFASSPSGGYTAFAAFWQDLYAGHADVVLNGHQHWYERFTPQNPAGQADPAGVREFIVGTGGAGLMSLSTRLPTSEASNDTTHGVLRMTLHAGSYDWQFAPVAGLTFTDSGSTGCHNAASVPAPDTTPPTTTIACNGGPCASGWYGAPVTVSLSATDSGSGVARTAYTTDCSDPATSSTAVTYSGPFTVSSSTTVRYFSTDTAGNAEATQSQAIQVDTVGPTTGITCNGTACGGTYTAPVQVGLTATDAGGSGVARIVYTTDGSDPAASPTAQPYAGPFTVSSTTTVKADAIDNAGNTGFTASALVSFGATASSPYPGLVEGRASLLAYWRLGESGGTTAADTTGAYPGTYTGAVTLGTPGALVNDPDTAAGFTGSTGTVTVPSLPPVGDFSVEGWTYLTNAANVNNTVYGTSGAVRILARPGAPNSSTAGYASVWLGGTEYALQPLTTVSNLNTWVHWVLTRQGSVLTLYRDGVAIGQRADLPATATASLTGAIGLQANGNYPLTGRVDEVALYTGALSATDVSADYQAAGYGQAPTAVSYRNTVLGESGLVSYWRLGESAGTVAADSKGANAGTYSGVSLGVPGAIVNDPDTAAAFNGSTSWVTLPALAGVGDFTIEGWTYLTNGNVTNNTVYGASGTVRLLARPGSVTAAYAGVWLGGTEYTLQPTATASNLNTWVYWTVTRKGNTLTLYRDGTQIGQRTDLPATATASISGSIGAQGGSLYFLTGRVDEVAVYSSALSATAVANHYSAALNGPGPT
jgi:concanavalin A-like lectin/glucanase superfamily protein/chitobiase/beta-hexosaminidase-like protein/calcineurin-like phosphoesterase family protein